MKIAVASGKGGTGKTTVSAALISLWDRPVVAVDLDVEEPNLHLFLNPHMEGRQPATLEVPVVDESKCNRCGQCSDLCQFKAISRLGDIILTFPEMCHGCGGCFKVCPENAIKIATRTLGDIEWGRAGNAEFLMGRLRVGEAMSPPLMREVKTAMTQLSSRNLADAIIDAPPGVSCPSVNAVMDSDVILLVTEPTPFGAWDLSLAHKAFSPLEIPMGVVVNRAGIGNDQVHGFCRRNHLDIICEIPFDRKIAEVYSQGKIVPEALPEFIPVFEDLKQNALKLADCSKEVRVA